MRLIQAFQNWLHNNCCCKSAQDQVVLPPVYAYAASPAGPTQPRPAVIDLRSPAGPTAPQPGPEALELSSDDDDEVQEVTRPALSNLNNSSSTKKSAGKRKQRADDEDEGDIEIPEEVDELEEVMFEIGELKGGDDASSGSEDASNPPSPPSNSPAFVKKIEDAKTTMTDYASKITDPLIQQDIMKDIQRISMMLDGLDEKNLPEYIEISKAFCPTQPGRHPRGSFSLTDTNFQLNTKSSNATIRAVSKAQQHITPQGVFRLLFIIQARNICSTDKSKQKYEPCEKERKEEGEAKGGLVNVFGKILQTLKIPACLTSNMGTSTRPHFFFNTIDKSLFDSHVLEGVYHPSIWLSYNPGFGSFEVRAHLLHF